MNLAYPERFVFRKKGLPKRLRRIGVEGLVGACDIPVLDGHPFAKVAVFRTRTDMRRFYTGVLPRYSGCEDIGKMKLGRRCAGFVDKLSVRIWNSRTEKTRTEVDKNYFCLVGLVERDLTAEVLSHEAVHVGFAWDWRTGGKGELHDPDNYEENVCYPAGIFLDQVVRYIKEQGFREV